MIPWQLILLTFSGFNLFLFIRSVTECKHNNSYKLTRLLFPLGIYVWGDALVISIFWASVSLFSVIVGNLYLFLTFASLFWVVRSLGETLYWLNQQFSPIKREPPEKVELYSLVKNDSVWFIQQIKNQCMTVIALVASIYFTSLWLRSTI